MRFTARTTVKYRNGRVAKNRVGQCKQARSIPRRRSLDRYGETSWLSIRREKPRHVSYHMSMRVIQEEIRDSKEGRRFLEI